MSNKNGADDRNDQRKWLSKIRAGDEQAFEALFKEYYSLLSRFVWRYIKSKAIAEELVQEVFADVWERRKELEPTGSIRSYLYQAAKHRALDYLKHQEVQQEYDPKWMEEKELPTINFEDPRREKQVRNAIKKEIEELPSRSKMTYKLHRHDGLTYKEIANVVGGTEHSVRYDWRVARAWLKRELG